MAALFQPTAPAKIKARLLPSDCRYHNRRLKAPLKTKAKVNLSANFVTRLNRFSSN